MKLSNHPLLQTRRSARTSPGAASPLAGQTTESPSGKMLTQAGVDSIVDSIARSDLGPRDPLIDGGAFPTKGGAMAFVGWLGSGLLLLGRSVNARATLADGWWKVD